MNSNDFHSILELIESKFSRGSSKNWKNRDFEDLNFEITKKTKTNISAHTLKRIFGKIKTDEYYLPQKATILALKQYIDFETNTSTNSEIENTDTSTDSVLKQDNINQNNKKSKEKLITYSVFFIVFVILSIFIYQSIESKNNIHGEVKLISTEGQIPTSAQFEYSTPNNKDSFRIGYDNEYEALPIPNGKKMKSNYYYQYPGMFRVRMWNKNSIVSPTISVYVQTKGWEVFGYYHKQKQLERFYPIELKKCMHDSIFSPSKTVIHNVGIDTAKLAEITLNNYHPTGINGDDFVLETTLKNSEKWPGATCNSAYLYIVGKKESIELHFANPGCSYWIHCRLSEKKLDKRNENLKNFTFDLTKWQHFRIVNTNKHITISVNNIERFSSVYNESIGEIMGVALRFQGNGYLKDYRLSDKNGKAIFSFSQTSTITNE